MTASTSNAARISQRTIAERMAAPHAQAGAGWIFAYLGIQMLCQLALITSFLGPVRVFFRAAAFGTSLVFLLLVPGKPSTQHPVRIALFAIMLILTLSAMNPDGNGTLATLAHWAFYLAIAAPVLWVARLQCDERTVRQLLVMLWAFSSASATVGVLQAYFPGQFQPNIGFLVDEQGKRALGGLMIRLSSGEWIPRPMGLTDVPGGAATGGFYAALLGIGFGVTRPFRYARLAGAASIVAGMTCLYLCQVRAALVMLGIAVTALVILLALAGRLSRVAFVAVAGAGLVIGTFYFAFSLGGENVTRRLEMLTWADPGTVYYYSRGAYLEETVNELLPRYPLGAGLGRWGMMNTYFAGNERMLWAEIQWTGWLYDGGIPMLIAYPVAVLLLLWYAARLAIRASATGLGSWAVLIAAYDVGALALTFSYPIFMSTVGIEFWLINAALIQAGESQRLGQPALPA